MEDFIDTNAGGSTDRPARPVGDEPAGNARPQRPRRRLSTRTALLVSLTVLVVAVGVYGALEWTPWFGSATASVDAHEEHPNEGKYTCPMHPQVISDKPGICPICFMDLVPVSEMKKKDDGAVDKALVEISERGRVIADVATTTVTSRALHSVIRATAGVDYNEATHRVITSRYAGRIERLFIGQTGRYVTRGQALMEIYSPELVAAQQEYLVARETPELALPTLDANAPATDSRRDRLVSAARKRLELLGMSANQIAALDRRGEIAYTTTVFADASGLVIKRGVTDGAYVNPGSLLFELVDLSSVYVIANVPEADAWRVRVGQGMKVTGPALGTGAVQGSIDFVYPAVDVASRTVRVRAVVANPGTRLKPGMFVAADILAPQGDMLAVPASAVIRTGRRDLVYLQVGENTFEPREIRLGIREGEWYQVAGGDLKKGDRIVAEGGYLVDSESRLSAPAGGGAGHEGH